MSARSRRRQTNDEDEDMMEDVEEEAEVDSSLYATSSPIQYAAAPSPPTQAYSPSTYAYALTDPFLAAQLRAAEQRTRQPSFFAQIATAQQHVSPFYTAARQSQQETSSPVQNQSTKPSMRLTVDTSTRRLFSAVRWNVWLLQADWYQSESIDKNSFLSQQTSNTPSGSSTHMLYLFCFASLLPLSL